MLAIEKISALRVGAMWTMPLFENMTTRLGAPCTNTEARFSLRRFWLNQTGGTGPNVSATSRPSGELTYAHSTCGSFAICISERWITPIS